MADPNPTRPKSLQVQLDNCTFCPKMCRHACPVSTAAGKETWIPQAKMDRYNQLTSGMTPWTVENAEALWACTGCRHCTMYCEHDNEPGLALLAGRAEAVAHGAAPAVVAEYPEKFRRRDQRLAVQARAAFADRLATSGDLGVWPGCDAIDKGAADVAAMLAVVDRFSKRGAPLPVVDAPQVCGGYPLLAAGYRDMFRWHATKVAASLRGFQAVVVNCSACVYAMRSQYAGEGVELQTKIISVPELLQDELGGLRELPPPTTNKQVYYHDPCHHARYNGVIDPPRALLGVLAEVREFSWSGTDAECCGGAGLLPKTQPAVADAMAKRRLAEVHGQGGGLVVTSCATCAFMLKRNAPPSVEIADLSTAVAQLSQTAFDAPMIASDDTDDA